jgi:hypothetical protein
MYYTINSKESLKSLERKGIINILDERFYHAELNESSQYYSCGTTTYNGATYREKYTSGCFYPTIQVSVEQNRA